MVEFNQDATECDRAGGGCVQGGLALMLDGFRLQSGKLRGRPVIPEGSQVLQEGINDR